MLSLFCGYTQILFQLKVRKTKAVIEIFLDESKVAEGKSKKDKFKPGQLIYYGGMIKTSKLARKIVSLINILQTNNCKIFKKIQNI